MTTFESDIKKIESNDEKVFSILSDLNNLEKVRNKMPSDKIKDLEFDTDSCHFTVDPIGKVGLVIVERESPKTIKFTAEDSPIAFNLWIQLKQKEENDTRLKITVKADINPMLKMMVSKPLENFVNKLAEVISQLPYNELA